MSNINDLSCECVVIGAGIIGLSIASKLASNGIEVIVVEKEITTMQHASSHNSEVIHSGIYYPSGSLKSNLCIQGNELLYKYCREHNIDFLKSGKLIFIENSKSLDSLEKLSKNGMSNGIKSIKYLEKNEIEKIEPNLIAHSALLVESTGTLDSHNYALSHEATIQNNGGHIATNSPLLHGERHRSRWKLKVGGSSDCTIYSDLVINSSGYDAIEVSRKLGVSQLINYVYVKGHYYKYNAYNPFRYLIYPLPESDGLGIHTSTDMSGSLRFGPDAEVVTQPNYKFEGTKDRKNKFSNKIRKYFRGFDSDKLSEDYTGIRVRISKDHNLSDFIIDFYEDHGKEGLVNLIGIESPGLTSSLAIADYILKKI